MNYDDITDTSSNPNTQINHKNNRSVDDLNDAIDSNATSYFIQEKVERPQTKL